MRKLKNADTFSVEDPVRKVGGGGTAGGDRWEGEDEDEDVKDNWDDDDDDEKKEEAEVKPGKPLRFFHFWFYILVNI
uniref:Eukaryotic translation initiation factor 3 subunit J-like isoform X9 n=1 Tax=Tursiops truncatus TaxID=9739 RepID=A0A6J3R077_TURTR|nr:eukaryotic translation initiation factor 3 subunit J-like isoform X9 [Tursiops truncatus]